MVTFKNSGLDKTISEIDLKHLVLETDSPYLAPAPNRGKRNIPAYLKLVAEKIAAALEKISPMKVQLISIRINKHSHHDEEVKISIDHSALKDKIVIVVDDVLNSGKTMMYALRPFLSADLKKLRTVVLVDRNHKRYPISADFAGLSLATTLKEHVSVVLNNGSSGVYLE